MSLFLIDVTIKYVIAIKRLPILIIGKTSKNKITGIRKNKRTSSKDRNERLFIVIEQLIFL